MLNKKRVVRALFFVKRIAISILVILVVKAYFYTETKYLYTEQECLNMKKGDTIYIEGTYALEKAIVINNNKKKHLIEVKESIFDYRPEILKYSQLKIKM